MDVLKKGVDEATKSIGEGLIDSLAILSEDTSVQTMADNFENMGDNIAYATVQMAKLIKGFSDLVDSPSFKAGILATGLLLSARRGDPKFFLGAMGIVGGSAGMSALTKDYSDKSSSNSANVRESRLNQAFRTSIKYRTIENNQIKAKTELNKLADEFDVERIGLMKALNETTDAETKLRIQAKLAILDNNEALAKKIAAELEAAKKATELANAFGGATQALAAQMGKLQTAVDNAFNAILAKIATTGFMPPASVIAGLSLVDQLRIEKAEDAFTALNLTNPEFIASMASERQAVSAISGGGNQFSLSFDTTFTGDRFTQLIAESLQLSEKTGYSTSPAGSINP
jgi:hypothetical protein